MVAPGIRNSFAFPISDSDVPLSEQTYPREPPIGMSLISGALRDLSFNSNTNSRRGSGNKNINIRVPFTLYMYAIFVIKQPGSLGLCGR